MTPSGLVSGTPTGGVTIDGQPDAVSGAGTAQLPGFESVDGPQGGLSMTQRLLTNNPDPAYHLDYRDGNVTGQNLCTGDDNELYGAGGPQLNSAVNNTDEAGRNMWGGGQFSNLFYQRSIYYEAPGQADGPRRLAEMEAPLDLSLQGVELTQAPSYVRPKSATPLRVPLVPAYQGCTSPNRTHGPPLAFPSCAPPEQTSQDLTVGTPDANQKPANSTGSVIMHVVSCPACASPLPTADVRIDASITDVRNRSDLGDYTGELEGRFGLRLTDRYNAAGAGDPQTDPATVEDTSFKFAMPCASTSEERGATCAVTTSANAVMPGSVRDRDRAIWELGAIGLYDSSGALFASQGVFVP
jgi:hypothetical protein